MPYEQNFIVDYNFTEVMNIFINNVIEYSRCDKYLLNLYIANYKIMN